MIYAMNSSIQKKVRSLRKLLTDNGIHNLAALEAFVHFGGSRSFKNVAESSHQSHASICCWANLLEYKGLITRGTEAKKTGRSTTYTEAGTSLMNQLTELLCPSQKT